MPASSSWSARNLPFIFGAQYYRAPTPPPESWASDLRIARDMGMTDLKFWVQWRVSHLAEKKFRFDDIDRLMDLAAAHEFRVTLNIIYDVMPQWVLHEHPDCLMVCADGTIVRPHAYQARQVGGAQGPCLNHPQARDIRRQFTRAVVEHYRDHPALEMWDMWNEPEQYVLGRSPKLETLVCYCPVCEAKFKRWLAGKYETIERLNQVWGRFYDDWSDIELPIAPGTLVDMVDWRLFMLDTVTEEAQWRIDEAKAIDPDHPVYTHVVPFIAGEQWGFNQITCSDDFALGVQGDVFAGSINLFPDQPVKVVSAAKGRVCYNVESHINVGSTAAHPAPLTLDRLKMEFLAQIGLGVRGFMFWQLRAETLGLESPAWGLLDPGGRPRMGAESTRTFLATIRPHLGQIMQSQPPTAEAGIVITATNEIFQWQLGHLPDYRQAMNSYADLLYRASVPYRYVSAHDMTRERLAGLKLLILPMAYCMTQTEADAVAEWVDAGGTLIAEAHTAGYSMTTGRHEGVLPGMGLAERFGIEETEAAGRVDQMQAVDADALAHVPSDVLTAMGGKFHPDKVPLRLTATSEPACGYKRCVGLKPTGQADVIATFGDGSVAIVAKSVGNGRLLYAGTNLGNVLGDPSTAIPQLLLGGIRSAVTPTCSIESTGSAAVHLDQLVPDRNKPPMFIAISDKCGTIDARWHCPHPLRGLFTGMGLISREGSIQLTAEGPFADMFIVQ